MAKVTEFGERYTADLRDYLTGAGEAALQRAYELGRRALNEGVGILEIAAFHHQALEAILRTASTRERAIQLFQTAEHFLIEILSPFEMAHRGFRETNALLRRLNQTLEEEYKRIAHALHDEAGQLLASVHLALDEMARAVSPAHEHLHKVKGLLDQIEGQLRQLSHELRPTILDDLGLVPALKFLAEGVAARTGLRITVEADPDLPLSPLLETTLYRVVQEALTNVMRHAKASQVRIQLHHEALRVRCSIRDDGVGFDASSALTRPGRKGLGLLGMQERLNSVGGSLSVVSASGQGTELTIAIPCTNQPEE